MRGRLTIAAFTVAAVLGLAQVGTASATEGTSTTAISSSLLGLFEKTGTETGCVLDVLGIKLLCSTNSGTTITEIGIVKEEQSIVIGGEKCLLKIGNVVHVLCGPNGIIEVPVIEKPGEKIELPLLPTGPAGPEGKAGAAGPPGPAGAPAPAPKGEVLASKVTSASGIARLARWGVRLRIRRGSVAIPIRCDGKAGLICRSRLQIVASRWSAKRAFRLRAGTGVHWVKIRVPNGLVRSVHRTRHGIRTYVDISSGRIAQAAALHRGIVRLIR